MLEGIMFYLGSVSKLKEEVDNHLKYDYTQLATKEEQLEGFTYKKRETNFPLIEAQKLYIEDEAMRYGLKFNLDSVSALYKKIEQGGIENIIKNPRQAYTEFRGYTSCISSFFTRLLKHPCFSRGYHYIEICCMDEVISDKVVVLGKRETGYTGVYKIQIPIDYKKFKSLSNYDKKKQALEFLMTGIRQIANYQNWDMKPFKEAYNTIVEANYINEWKRDSPKELVKHNTKNIKAGIGGIHDNSKSEFFVFVCDNEKKELYRKTLITVGNEKDYQAYLGLKAEYFVQSETSGSGYEARKGIEWKGENRIIVTNTFHKFWIDKTSEAKVKLDNRESLEEYKIDEYEKYLGFGQAHNPEFYDNVIKKALEAPPEWTITVPYSIIANAPAVATKTTETRIKESQKNVSKFSDKLHEKIYDEIYDNRHDNYDTIYSEIVNSFKNLFTKINKTEKEIGYIDIAWLRSNIKNKGNFLLISAYDARWYFDKNPIQIYYDCSWLIGYFHRFKEGLQTEARKYVGKVTKPYVEKLSWEILNKDYTGFALPMFRNAIEDILQLEEYQLLKKPLIFAFHLVNIEIGFNQFGWKITKKLI